jgi:hypothetical protein
MSNFSASSDPRKTRFLDFETLTPFVDDLPKKQTVTTQSLRKVEEGKLRHILYWASMFFVSYLSSAAYAIAIRSSEYDLSAPMLDHIVGTTSSEELGPSSRQRRRDPASIMTDKAL